jgi:hypothetical protein
MTGEKIEIYPKIFVVEDFLLPEEVAALDKRCREASELEWSTQIQKDYEHMAKEKFPDDLEAQREYLEKGWDNVWTDKHLSVDECGLTQTIQDRLYSEFFPSDKYQVNSPARAQRQYPGCGGLRVHYDSEWETGMAMSIVIYINDDYNGGALHFVDHDIKVKPKAGSLLIFPSTNDYMHGVEEVLEGPSRYAIPAFVYHAGQRNY